MEDDRLIDCDSLNETVVPMVSLPLIITTYGAPQPAVVGSVLDFVKVKLFAMSQLLPSVKSTQLRTVKVISGLA